MKRELKFHFLSFNILEKIKYKLESFHLYFNYYIYFKSFHKVNLNFK